MAASQFNRRIGMEWVNRYNGKHSNLANSRANAEGFYNSLIGIHAFQWGDDDAWDQDFEQSGFVTAGNSNAAGDDTIQAETVDILFFSGHGNSSQLLFGTDHDNSIAANNEMSLGEMGVIKWLIADACMVLSSGYTDPKDATEELGRRWGRIFKGLHYILGFATNCTDHQERGWRFAGYLNNGLTISEAWLKACQETENAPVVCAHLRDSTPGSDTENDTWTGYVSPNPVPTSNNDRDFVYRRVTLAAPI